MGRAELALADWLKDLAVFGAPKRFYDAETTHHLSEAIQHWYLVSLAIEPLESLERRLIADASVRRATAIGLSQEKS